MGSTNGRRAGSVFTVIIVLASLGAIAADGEGAGRSKDWRLLDPASAEPHSPGETSS